MPKFFLNDKIPEVGDYLFKGQNVLEIPSTYLVGLADILQTKKPRLREVK